MSATSPDIPGRAPAQSHPPVLALEDLRRSDGAQAGGKGANLGELIAAGLPVPPGFVVSAGAYASFCDATGLRPRIAERLAGLDVEDGEELARAAGDIRSMLQLEPMPRPVEEAIQSAYLRLGRGDELPAVAVRSSATLEDAASASFAGMNETFLNVRGRGELLEAVRRCWSSLFGTRTIYYRARKGLPQAETDIAVVVQRQIEATRAGVMFTVDPASGDPDRLTIEAAFGLGESVVSGAVRPDRYVVAKDSLTLIERQVHRKELAVVPAGTVGTTSRELRADQADTPALSEQEALDLAEIGSRIESHYGAPQDIEFAIDGANQTWIVQSRPITTTSGRSEPGAAPAGPELVRGLGAAPGLAAGPVRAVSSREEAGRLRDGEILVSHMTTPDWVPLMKRAAAIVTDSGGMTCHAAIVSRELGLPCVVGTGRATSLLHDGQLVSVDGGRGVVTEGIQAAERPADPSRSRAARDEAPPEIQTKLLVNLSEPSQIGRVKDLDVDGVGLLRAELMMIEALEGEHPRALIDRGESEVVVTRMAAAIEEFAAAFSPRPVTYRTIDFRSNEFRGLRGGERYEPQETNPMIGYRGTLRYGHEPDLFDLELKAVDRVWAAGHSNVHLMLPFVRVPQEVSRCRERIDRIGLGGRPGFELWLMAEVPSVLFHLPRYAVQGITGISIGSNDLTQLLLGADRDSELVAEVFDERDPAVTEYITQLIARARDLGLKTSICGQAPSVHPEYAELLVEAGIDAISVNLDATGQARALIAAAESGTMCENPDRGGPR